MSWRVTGHSVRCCSLPACCARSSPAPPLPSTSLPASPQANRNKEMAMRAVKAAAVQLSPVLYSREGTVDKVVRKIDELGQQGVQFATFPETVVPYYPYFSFLQPAYQIVGGREHMKLLDQAVTVPSAATHAIGDACRQAQVVVSIGVNEREGGAGGHTKRLLGAGGRLGTHSST